MDEVPSHWFALLHDGLHPIAAKIIEDHETRVRDAVLAERARCAKWARSLGGEFPEGSGERGVADEICAAIEGGEACE